MNRSTYVYDFSYRQSFLGYADWVNGSHLDDLYSVFGNAYTFEFSLTETFKIVKFVHYSDSPGNFLSKSDT